MDPYLWFDPFEKAEEAERANRRADSAYREGQSSILREIAGEKQKYFTQVLDAAVEQVASKLAWDSILHQLRDHYADARQAEQLQKARQDFMLSTIASPLVSAIHNNGKLTFDIVLGPDHETLFQVEYQILNPVHYYYRFSPRW